MTSKPTIINKESLVPIGMVFSLLSGAVFATTAYQQLQYTVVAVGKLSEKMDKMIDEVGHIKTDQVEIRTEVKSFKPRIENTQANMKRVNKKLNRLAGPVSLNGSVSSR